MTFHQSKTAFPIGVAANKTEARRLFVQYTAYVISVASDAQNLVAVDPDMAAVVQVIVLNGKNYLYDPLDGSSVHDGTTVLVTSDGKRYKLSDQHDVLKYSVINITTTTPPGSPTLGDAYLVGVGGTGAWSGHDRDVAVRTARGWEFVEVQIGQFIYDKSTDSYYHLNASSVLTLGFGSQAIGANLIKISSIIGQPVRVRVENQTTNTPPGSPSIGDAYIIGSVPTGAWTGNAGKLAICEVGTTFTIYTPGDGWVVYDKAQKNDYRYSSASSTWISAAGAIVGNPQTFFTADTTNSTTGGTGNYTTSDTVAPTTAFAYWEDSNIITYTARKTGARLRFFYQYIASNSNIVTVALFKDSDVNALAWYAMQAPAGSRSPGLIVFETTAADASSHTYKIRLVQTGATIGTPSRRRFSIEEFS